MSNWSDIQITAKGRALDAKVTAGATTLVFTKMQLGSGIVAAENVDNMERLDSPRMDLGISSCAVSKADNTICSVVAVASSNNVENSFLIKELGLFATDPDDGEILYAIMFDTEPDRMPNKNVASPVTLTFQVNVMSANAASIKAVIDPAGLISMATLNAVVDEHNNDKNAHGVMLGEHNADGKSHQDIRKKIAADITKHNKDEAAHSDIRQLIVDHNTNPKSHPHQLRPPLKRSTAYTKGDICFHDSLPSYACLECITAGTTAKNEPVFTDVNTTITDGTATFRVITSVRKVNGNYADKNGNISVNVATQSMNGLLSAADKKKLDSIATEANKYSHPNSGVSAGTYTSVTVNAQGHVTAGSNPTTNNILVGSVIWYAGAGIPANYLLCDGSAVSRTNYADLFAVIGTAYGAGNGSTTFNLPLLTDNRFIEGGNTPGTQHKAGLPNITIPCSGWGGLETTYSSPGHLASPYEGADGHPVTYRITANRTISMDGTMQPKSLTLRALIKYI